MEIQTTICLPPQQHSIIPVNQNDLPRYQPPNPDITCTINHQSFRQKLVSDITEEFKRHYTTELLIAGAYVLILKTTSFSHLPLAFELLEVKTGLSISPAVLSFFKYFLAILSSISIAFADVKYRPLRTSTILKYMGFIGTGLGMPLAHFFTTPQEKYQGIIISIIDLIYVSGMRGFNGYGKHGWLLNFAIYWLQFIIVLPIGIRTNMTSGLVLVISVLISSGRAADELELFTTSAPSLLCCLDKSIQKLLPVVGTRLKSALKEKKVGKFIKYALGLVGTVIFQSVFQLTTFGHVRAFMYLATSWIANLALINASSDFGILNFLLGNMILGSTVNQSGLGITTWISYCVCLFFYVLGIKLKSTNITQNFEKPPRPPIIFWIFYCCISVDSLFLFHYY